MWYSNFHIFANDRIHKSITACLSSCTSLTSNSGWEFFSLIQSWTTKLIISKTIFILNHTYRMFSLVIIFSIFFQIFHVKSTHSSHQQSPCVMTSAQPIMWIKLLPFHHNPTGFTHSQCCHPFYIYVITMMLAHFFIDCRWVFYHV